MDQKLNLSWLTIWFMIYCSISMDCTNEIEESSSKIFYGMGHLSKEFNNPPQLQEEIMNLQYNDEIKKEANGTYQLITYYQKIPMPEKNDFTVPRFIIQKNPVHGDWELIKIFDSHQEIIDSRSNVKDTSHPFRHAVIVSVFCSLQKSAKEMKLKTEKLEEIISKQNKKNESLLKQIKILKENENKSIQTMQTLEVQISEKNELILKLENKIKYLHAKFKKQFTQILTEKKEEHAKEINTLDEKHLELEKKMTKKHLELEKKMTTENEALKEHNLKEIQKMTKQYTLDKNKLGQFDEVQLQLKECQSQNEKLIYGQRILEEEKENLQNLNKSLKTEQKQLLKVYEDKSKQVEKKKLTKCSKMNKEGEKNIIASNQKLQTMLKGQKCAYSMDTWTTMERGKLQEFVIGSERSFQSLIQTFWYKICEPEKNILQEIKMILENRKSILTDPKYYYQAMLLLKGGFDFINGEKKLLGNILQTEYGNEEILTVQALENVEMRLKDDLQHILDSCKNNVEVQRFFNNSKIDLTKEVASYESAILNTGYYIYGEVEQLAEMKKLSHQEEDNYIDKLVAKILDSFPVYSENDGKYLF